MGRRHRGPANRCARGDSVAGSGRLGKPVLIEAASVARLEPGQSRISPATKLTATITTPRATVRASILFGTRWLARAEISDVKARATRTADRIAHVSTFSGTKYVMSSGMSAPTM